MSCFRSLAIVWIGSITSRFDECVANNHLHIVLAIKSNNKGAKQKACTDRPWGCNPDRKRAEQQARRPQPHVDSCIVLFFRQRLHHLVLHKRQHDVIQASRQSANEEPDRILNGTSFEIETQRTDNSSEHEVMKIVVFRAVEAH